MFSPKSAKSRPNRSKSAGYLLYELTEKKNYELTEKKNYELTEKKKSAKSAKSARDFYDGGLKIRKSARKIKKSARFLGSFPKKS